MKFIKDRNLLFYLYLLLMCMAREGQLLHLCSLEIEYGILSLLQDVRALIILEYVVNK